MNTLSQQMAELQVLRSETERLEAQVLAELQALLTEFEASYPPLRIVDRLSIPVDRLSTWLRSPEAD